MANSKSISAGGNATSDEFNPPATAVEGMLIVKADNDGTVDDEVVNVKLLASTGDPDADPDSTDEFTTSGHAQTICSLDTTVEDPAISKPITLPATASGYKLYAANAGSTRAVTVSAQVRWILSDATYSETQVAWT